jgi:hypothetical protein
MSSGLLLSPTPSSPSVDASNADNSLQGSNSDINSSSNREGEGEGDVTEKVECERFELCIFDGRIVISVVFNILSGVNGW